MLAHAIHTRMINKTINECKVVVVGLGKTGLATARYFTARGIDFIVMDTRHQPPMLKQFNQYCPEATVLTGGLDTSLLLDAKQIILSPGVDKKQTPIINAINKGIEVIGDVELFCQQATAPILAVTGSNGKSTVVTLLAQMIEEAGYQVGLGGNVGRPVLDLLDEPNIDFYVLELSSFQLDSTFSLNAHTSVVLNVTEDHMDRYENLQAYADSKAIIYKGDGIQIINNEDKSVKAMRHNDRHVQLFSSKKPNQNEWGIGLVNERLHLMFGSQALIETEALKIKGLHNQLNALVCLAMGTTIDLPLQSMLKTLRAFKGLPHRCEWVSEFSGIAWINDSKATNVAASCAAITAVAKDKNVILIAGGHGKDSDFSPLRDVANGRVKQLITMGRDGPLIADVLADCVPHQIASTMHSAVRVAYRLADAGDVVLLSPACASLDMYQNYEARGYDFIDAVHLLASAAEIEE